MWGQALDAWDGKEWVPIEKTFLPGLLHYDGTSWSRFFRVLKMENKEAPLGLSVTASNEVWLLGSHGTVFRLS
jgi:hypothetical protein